jgi:hypothetical protein
MYNICNDEAKTDKGRANCKKADKLYDHVKKGRKAFFGPYGPRRSEQKRSKWSGVCCQAVRWRQWHGSWGSAIACHDWLARYRQQAEAGAMQAEQAADIARLKRLKAERHH